MCNDMSLTAGQNLDWEDYNYKREPAVGGRRQAENPLAALLAGIPDFNTEELEALLCDLPTQDDANQAAGMTVAEPRSSLGGDGGELHVKVWANTDISRPI